MSDAEAEAVLQSILRTEVPALGDDEASVAASLLAGAVFAQHRRRYTQELGLPRWEETEEEFARVVEAKHLHTVLSN